VRDDKDRERFVQMLYYFNDEYAPLNLWKSDFHNKFERPAEWPERDPLVKVHGFALMDNHYHLLIETPFGNLSRAMRHIDGVYTQRINRKYGKDGPIMRGRFKSILVDRDSYLLELVRYIHLNGMKALNYRTASDDPNTSHRMYLNGSSRPGWLTVETVLSQFHDEPALARKRMDQFVQEGINPNLEQVLSQKQWPAVLGAPEFVEKIGKKWRAGFKRDREIPQTKEMLRTIPPAELLEKIACAYHVDVNSIQKRSHGKFNEARQTAMILLRCVCGLSYAEIGQRLGNVSYGAIAPVCLKAMNHPDDLRQLERRIVEESKI
jgi:REP element-mobilizing transposase RayT